MDDLERDNKGQRSYATYNGYNTYKEMLKLSFGCAMVSPIESRRSRPMNVQGDAMD